jgi:hypothetical protein
VIEEVGDTLVVKHVHRAPHDALNIYLAKATDAQIEEAVREYGQAISELAIANIFPGDMLWKNFGVTRYGRVVFYDYDEIEYMTDCNFRKIPPAPTRKPRCPASPGTAPARWTSSPKSSPPSCSASPRSARPSCSTTASCSTRVLAGRPGQDPQRLRRRLLPLPRRAALLQRLRGRCGGGQPSPQPRAELSTAGRPSPAGLANPRPGAGRRASRT